MPSLANPIEESDPPTHKKTLQQPKFADAGNEYLQCIDGAPARPPPYRAVNPNAKIRFPVYEYEERSLEPPAYTPAVEHCTVVGIKCEWKGPFEPLAVERWRNFLLEINSTQLNLYEIDPELTQGIKNYSSGADEAQHTHLFSLGSRGCYQFSRADQEQIAASVGRNKDRYLHVNKLFKSFSLQCAKMGIPTDYARRTFVLRLRCEQEQFLVNFAHVDDMITWAMYLQMGISVSLDLDLREYPTYRIVPRRRRRSQRRSSGRSQLAGSQRPDGPRKTQSMGRLHLGSSQAHDASPRPRPRLKAQRTASSGLLPSLNKRRSSSSGGSSGRKIGSSSGDDVVPAHGIKSKLAHLFKPEEPQLPRNHSSGSMNNQFSPKRTPASSSAVTSAVTPAVTPAAKPVAKPAAKPAAAIAIADAKAKMHMTGLNSVLEDEERDFSPAPRHRRGHSSSQRPPPRPIVSSLLFAVSSESEGSSTLTQLTPGSTTPNEGSEVERVPSERDEHDASMAEDGNEDDAGGSGDSSSGVGRSVYVEEGIFHDSDDDYVYTRGNQQIKAPSASGGGFCLFPYYSDGGKWNPAIKEPSRGRYIRDSLHCIKSLNNEDTWIGRVIFRPHRAPDFPTNNLPLCYGVSPRTPSVQNKGTAWDGVDYRRTRNHYLKPYIVGPTGLVRANTKPHNIYEEV